MLGKAYGIVIILGLKISQVHLRSRVEMQASVCSFKPNAVLCWFGRVTACLSLFSIPQFIVSSSITLLF